MPDRSRRSASRDAHESDGTSGSSGAVDPAEAVAALRAAWPRVLIAEGHAGGLAEWWIAGRRAARAAGGPPFPRHPLDPDLAQALFEARRARRLERGLEAAEERLASEAAGLERAGGATRPDAAARISRLLVVSADAAPRFHRRVERLRERHADRLEVLLVEGDEVALGEAAFGRGRRARALLLTHKDAVVRLLRALEPIAASASRLAPGEGPDRVAAESSSETGVNSRKIR